jgi:hypothetical protein
MISVLILIALAAMFGIGALFSAATILKIDSIARRSAGDSGIGSRRVISAAFFFMPVRPSQAEPASKVAARAQ